MAYKKVRPAVALLVCVIVNDPFATTETYMLPLATSAAAVDVVAVRIGVEPTAHEPVPFGVTTVVALPVASVTVPTAFDRPAASCCRDRMIFLGSVSAIPGT